ncbi:MAG: hypothetical protein ACR2HJ_02785 [Fimbriimonadales bacterium]
MTAEAPALRSSEILRFYYPLALSWLFMALESPIAIGVLSRLSGVEVNTAAFFVLMGLALWIESPVIDLLSTSTTLSKNYQDFLTLQRFALGVIGVVTAVHFLVAWTPLYGFITESIMGIPPEVADAARDGFRIMVLWSAFIGWRRFLQGVMIRHGMTKRVGYGTLVRLSTMAVSALSLYKYTGLPSISIAAIALMCSVAAEAVYVHFAAMDAVRMLELEAEGTSPGGLTLPQLLRFHLPLTATTAVMMLGAPVVGAALARAPNSVLALAGWQVAQSLLWLHRTIVFALPEVVITLYQDNASALKLRQFSLNIGLATSGLLFLVAFSRVDIWFFSRVLRAERDVAEVAHLAFIAGGLTPLIGALQSYVRGMLTAHHLTMARFAAVIVSMGLVTGLLFLTVVTGIAGVVSAGGALTIALAAELGVLIYSWRRGRPGDPVLEGRAVAEEEAAEEPLDSTAPHEDRRDTRLHRQAAILPLIVAVGLLIALIRLWYLQVVR